MPNWKKRVATFTDNGLAEGEEPICVAFLQPVGSLTETTGRATFGLLGMLVSKKMTSGKKNDNAVQASAKSKAFPSGAAIVAVTNQGRIMVYEQAALSGKPKKLLQEYKIGEIKADNVRKGMLKSDMTLAFSDGGRRTFELAKGQNIDEFVAALHASN